MSTTATDRYNRDRSLIRTASHYIYHLSAEGRFHTNNQYPNKQPRSKFSEILGSVASIFERSVEDRVAVSSLGHVVHSSLAEEKAVVDEDAVGLSILPVSSFGLADFLHGAIRQAAGGFAEHVGRVQGLVRQISRAQNTDAYVLYSMWFDDYILVTNLSKTRERFRIARKAVEGLMDSDLCDQPHSSLGGDTLTAGEVTRILQGCSTRLAALIDHASRLEKILNQHEQHPQKYDCIQKMLFPMKDVERGMRDFNEYLHRGDKKGQRLKAYLARQSSGKLEAPPEGEEDEVRDGGKASSDTRTELPKDSEGDCKESSEYASINACFKDFQACKAIATAVAGYKRTIKHPAVAMLTEQPVRIFATGSLQTLTVDHGGLFEVLREVFRNEHELLAVQSLEKAVRKEEHPELRQSHAVFTVVCEALLVAEAWKEYASRPTTLWKPMLDLGMSKPCCLVCDMIVDAVTEAADAPFQMRRRTTSDVIWPSTPPPDLSPAIVADVRNKTLRKLVGGLDPSRFDGLEPDLLAALHASGQESAILSESLEQRAHAERVSRPPHSP